MSNFIEGEYVPAFTGKQVLVGNNDESYLNRNIH
jgi:hypothetical protein